MDDQVYVSGFAEDPEPGYCDLCGESMKYKLTNVIGVQLSITGIESLEKVLIDKFGKKDFVVCWVCWIKSLGFKERD